MRTFDITRSLAAGLVLTGLAAMGCAGAPQLRNVTLQDFEQDPYQGRYPGQLTREGQTLPGAAALLIADGKGCYRVVLEWQGATEKDRILLTARREAKDGDGLVVTGKDGEREWTGRVNGAWVSLATKAPHRDRFHGTMVHQASPTLGAPPPPGAIVLLPRDQAAQVHYDSAFTNPAWRVQPDGSVKVGKKDTRTRRSWGDCRIHLEFLIPYMPESRGQARGNSGVYVQDRYEVQLLDSFGLVSRDNDCGGIYKIAAPLTNACLPPLRWQTYDITFQAPRFGRDGRTPVKPAVITVLHNGVPIHKDLELPHPTAGGPKDQVRKAPLRLQDHHNPLRFRNIWILER